MRGKIFFFLPIILLASCSSQSQEKNPSSYDYSYISEEITSRTDQQLRETEKTAEESGQFELPEWVSLEDGLSEEESIALALWNNAEFQTDLAELGFARAELQQANMLKNPVFSILFPISPKLLETALDLPLDFLFERPKRIDIAELNTQIIAESLIENGLELVRDVRLTYAELKAAHNQLYLEADKAQIQVQLARLDQTRVLAGDISEMEASNSYINTLQAADKLKQISMQIDLLKQKLNNLLGITSEDITFDIISSDSEPMSAESVDELLEIAFTCRPELRAAELEIEVNGQQIGWEKAKVYSFIAVLDGDNTEDDGFTVRPGFSVEIPIFNQNDPAIAKAKAQLEQSAKQYHAIRQKIILQVKQAYISYNSISEQFNDWSENIIPSLEIVLQQTQTSFYAGDVSNISVLQAQQKLLDAQIYLSQLYGDLQRSKAELDYYIGMKV